MSDVDDFVFQYLLTLNRSYWQFRHQPRNAQIEQEIIKLGQKEYAIEHDHKFQEIMRHTLRPFTNSVWKQLDLGELRDELRRFSIVSPEILEKFQKSWKNFLMSARQTSLWKFNSFLNP